MDKTNQHKMLKGIQTLNMYTKIFFNKKAYTFNVAEK